MPKTKDVNFQSNVVCDKLPLLLYSICHTDRVGGAFKRAGISREKGGFGWIIGVHLRSFLPQSGLWPAGTWLTCTEYTQYTNLLSGLQEVEA